MDEAGVLNVVQEVEYFEPDAWADLLYLPTHDLCGDPIDHRVVQNFCIDLWNMGLDCHASVVLPHC